MERNTPEPRNIVPPGTFRTQDTKGRYKTQKAMDWASSTLPTSGAWRTTQKSSQQTKTAHARADNKRKREIDDHGEVQAKHQKLDVPSGQLSRANKGRSQETEGAVSHPGIQITMDSGKKETSSSNLPGSQLPQGKETKVGPAAAKLDRLVGNPDTNIQNGHSTPSTSLSGYNFDLESDLDLDDIFPPMSKRKTRPATIPSSSAPPHETLEYLLTNLTEMAKFLEAHDADRNPPLSPQRLAKTIRRWEGELWSAIHNIEAAEDQRIIDIKEALDRDEKREAAHNAELEKREELWATLMSKESHELESKLREKDEEWTGKVDDMTQATVDEVRKMRERWEKETAKQKEAYESEIAKLKKELEQKTSERDEDKATPEGMMKMNHEDTVYKIKEGHKHEIENINREREAERKVFKDKVDRLADENAKLRETAAAYVSVSLHPLLCTH